jgi:exonuclease SbcC
MKILKLRFENLNSLYGKWEIDFTAPEFESNSIFALTGPTGAGKSTILDAICLSLYAATPRLGKITKSANEIMSRNTGECFAETTFESSKGKFTCYFYQHRARKKPDGNLLDSKHEISDAKTGKILESKKRDVASVIEEKTGMDFDRFTRSILLAQGGFDTFLKADAEQKSKILEQITGTEIYTEISKKVHEKQREEQARLNDIKNIISQIHILTKEEEEEISDQVRKNLDNEKKEKTLLDDTIKNLNWLKTIKNLENEIESACQDLKNLEKQLEVFEPERKKIEDAKKALNLQAKYENLKSERKNQLKDSKKSEQLKSRIPIKEDILDKKEKEILNLKKLSEEFKKELKEKKPFFQKIRLMDQNLKDLESAVNNSKKDYEKAHLKLNEAKELFKNKDIEISKNQNSLKNIIEFLEKTEIDESLSGLIGTINEKIENLSYFEKKYKDCLDLINSNRKKLSDKNKNLLKETEHKNNLKKDLKKIRTETDDKNNTLKNLLNGRLLREFRDKKDFYLKELYYQKKIISLEDERKKLENGKPCPLCGSLNHPYCEGNVFEINETEKKIKETDNLIKNAESLETQIKESEKKEQKLIENLNLSEKNEAVYSNEITNLNNSIKSLENELEELNKNITSLKNNLFNELKPFGINDLSNPQKIKSELDKRLEKRTNAKKTKENLEADLNKSIQDIKHIEGLIETGSSNLREKKDSLEKLKNEYLEKEETRNKIFGTKNPDIEEEKLEAKNLKAASNEQNEKENYSMEKQSLESIKENIDSLETEIKKREKILSDLEEEFKLELKNSGFFNEENFIEKSLVIKELEALEKKAKSLDSQKISIDATINDRTKRLDKELEKKLTDLPFEELENKKNEFEENLKILQADTAEKNHRLKENNSSKEKSEELLKKLEMQKTECSKWDRLHFLIGSADGKKYRNFAQGLTFELMVSHANIQLEKMSDRYLLTRDKNEPLDLNVIDNYQAGEIRSTKNLSGGESFIVSLSLALGLSKMASRKVRVDSLFLDEGFGTLDDEALDTALETLASLKEEGKIIGVISHVSALKDRIPAQIQINPLSGGKSKILGPGCRNITE